MAKLPTISGQTLIKVLVKCDFAIISQKGSHIKVIKVLDKGRVVISVPNHKVLKKGTLRAILRQAGITPQELNKLLK